MSQKPVNKLEHIGIALYDLYKANPPERNRGAQHAQAYWDGFDGRPNKFPRTSYGYWAYKAGKDARRSRQQAR